MSNLMNDIFSGVPNVQLEPESSTPTNEFRPNPKKGKNGVFKAIIRFLPNPSDPVNKSVIKKNVVKLTNPVTNESRYIDCPSSVGKPDPIVDTFFKLRNSENAVKKEQSAVFSRKQRFASLIQVISCESDPTLNNRILVWNYGIKVYNKVAQEMTPVMAGVEPKNPFDLLNGRVFVVSVKEVSGYPNYDDCQFYDTDQATRAFRIGIPQADGTMVYTPITPEFVSNENGRQKVMEFYTQNAPDTTSYEYHDWDDDTAQFVANVIRMYTSNEAFTPVQATTILNQTMQQPQQVRVAQGAPSPNDLAALMNNSAPAAPAAPAPMPQAPAAQPGLQLGVTSVPGMQQSGPGFNPASLGVPGLSDILGGSSAPAAPSTPAPSLNDILSTTIV